MNSISIIIPVLNEATQIGDAIRYLFRHSPVDQIMYTQSSGHTPIGIVEIIVVDGGSTDDTRKIAASAGAVVITSAASRAVQMNAGAKVAKGNILYFVHADTRPPATFTTDILQAIEQGKDMGCYRYVFDRPDFLLKINAWFNRFSWLWCQGGDKTFFIKKTLFDQLGGYNEQYVIMEEYDFLRRATSQYRLHTLPKYAIASARKYEHNSWLRVQFANMLVFNLFRLGLAPVRLKKLYSRMIKK